MDPSSSFKQPLAPTSTVRNPYLNFRPPTVPPGEVDSIAVKDAEAKPEAPLGDCSNTSGQEDRRSPVEEKKEDEDATNRPPPPAPRPTSSPPTTPNTGLAYWERLPSKNLSQASAEILTVDECVKHCLLYRGRAVRVTGQLHQRTFVGDDVETPRLVLLELLDPTPMATQASQYRTSGSTPAKESTTHTPGKTSLPPSTSKTPTDTVKTTYKTPLKTLGPARRPGSSIGSSSFTLLGNSSTKTPSSTILSEKRKRPWFATTSARKKTPPKTAPRLLLKVLVDPALPRLDTIAPSGTSKVMVLGVILDSGWMQAQFVSLVDPRTDMSLYVTALQARRRHLYQRYKTLPRNSISSKAVESLDSSTTDVESTATDQSTCLLLGCGPPPYENLETKTK